jgi:molybdate transport system ATP-binding protein
MDRSGGLEVRLRQAAPIPLDAALDCAPGELLALVGPSGSGKTTILRAIAGLVHPAQGSVRCNGTAWFDADSGLNLPPQARQVGLVFQNYALFPHLSAQDNVAVALGHLPVGERVARARELLSLVHLAGLEARRPGQLSGGQQQRVALARALARDPKALLLDEPFAAVDQVTRRKLQQELARLRHQLRMPIVLVTHDLEEAMALADRMVILHRGQSLQSGPPQEVITRPANVEVARLVDLRNVFEGEIAADAPATLLWRDLRLELPPNAPVPGGTRICWAIPPAGIVLHRRDRPSQGERENPVSGKIVDFLLLGENTSVTMAVNGTGNQTLTFSIPTHVAARNGLALGVAIGVSLRAEAIHLMPWEQLPAG